MSFDEEESIYDYLSEITLNDGSTLNYNGKTITVTDTNNVETTYTLIEFN